MACNNFKECTYFPIPVVSIYYHLDRCEIVGVVLGEDVSIVPGFQNITMQIRLGAMIFFCAMVWLRYYSSKAKGKKMVEDPGNYFVD